MPTYNPITHPCNFFLLGGKQSPGHTVIEGNSGSPRKWEERGGYGLTGATIVFTGLGLAHFDAVISLYDQRDWEEWQAWRSILAPPQPGLYARAQDIWHPLLRPLEIGKAVVLDVAIPKQDADGVFQVLIPFSAYRRPKLTFAKPDGAKSKESDDPLDRIIASKSATIKAQLDRLGE